MDRHPQQVKRERQDLKRRTKNSADLSKLRNAIKKVMQSKKANEAEKLYKAAVSIIDKSAQKRLLKKNTASRRKSQITRHLNSLS